MSREMKHSGIEWIGEIPKEWKVMPFKQMYELGKGLSITKADLVEEGIPVISYGQIHSKANTGTTIKDELIRFVPDEFLDDSASSLLKKGDVVFADTSEDIEGCGNCVYIDRDITIFAGYHTIIAKYLSSKPNNYLSYLFKTDCWRSQIRSSVNGVKLFSVPQRLLGRTTIILPPLFEQQKIADYLDKVCGEVDEMIALQEQMIEELKAYKQSVITEAVTKGLNPNVPMKDSGIDWIGEVPEHWKVTVLRRFATIILGKMLQPNAKSDDDTLEQYICAKDVHFEGIDFSDLKKMYFDKNEKETYQVLKGDMLVVEGGAGAAGSCVLRNDLPNTYIQNSIMIVRPKQGIDIRYIQYFEFSLVKKGYVDYVCNKATIPHFTKDKLSSMPIPLPPLEEQQSIASYLDTKCAEIDALISIKQAKIDELKEYKKSVIYEYVTGKKQVI